MGATNHTTNYNLPQFVGSDKPTWLGDVNGAMNLIDAQMKSNNDLGTLAKTTADSAQENANTAIGTANQAELDARGANETATTALQKALTNEANINKFNLSVEVKPNLTASVAGATITQYQEGMDVKVMRDTTGSIFKLYGAFEIFCQSNVTVVTVTLSDTGLRPAEDYYISPIGGTKMGLGGQFTPQPFRAKVKTNGEIELELEWIPAFTGARVILFPCLYFNKNFGD